MATPTDERHLEGIRAPAARPAGPEHPAEVEFAALADEIIERHAPLLRRLAGDPAVLVSDQGSNL
ncbi:hypothetical protein [Pilimelia anulata]|nr:hypothetical protein [Pilimelia anulata]